MELSKFELIRDWAYKRNIILGSDIKSQLCKLGEEFGEVCAAIARGNKEALKDGIGDMVVVLTILAEQSHMSIEECINSAWEEIKDRKGKMVNGVFIKEGE